MEVANVVGTKGGKMRDRVHVAKARGPSTSEEGLQEASEVNCRKGGLTFSTKSSYEEPARRQPRSKQPATRWQLCTHTTQAGQKKKGVGGGCCCVGVSRTGGIGGRATPQMGTLRSDDAPVCTQQL